MLRQIFIIYGTTYIQKCILLSLFCVKCTKIFSRVPLSTREIESKKSMTQSQFTPRKRKTLFSSHHYHNCIYNHFFPSCRQTHTFILFLHINIYTNDTNIHKHVYIFSLCVYIFLFAINFSHFSHTKFKNNLDTCHFYYYQRCIFVCHYIMYTINLFFK